MDAASIYEDVVPALAELKSMGIRLIRGIVAFAQAVVEIHRAEFAWRILLRSVHAR